MEHTRIASAVAAAAVLSLAACSETVSGSATTSGSVTSPTVETVPSATATVDNGAFLVDWAAASGARRYPIQANGVAGVPAALPWASGAAATDTRLLDAVGPLALTATYRPPLTDVTRNRQLQVRDVITGEVRQRIDVPGWCSGPDGADYPCLLLDEARLARTTPLDGIEPGTVTISATDSGKTLAEFGPFPALTTVRATSSPDVLVLITFAAGSQRFLAQRLDILTGEVTQIGSLPIGQPWICVLGTDSILTAENAKLVALGPASVAPVTVTELDGNGPDAIGCTPDGRYLYVQIEPEAAAESEALTDELVIDAVALSDGVRLPAALTLPSRQATVRLTR